MQELRLHTSFWRQSIGQRIGRMCPFHHKRLVTPDCRTRLQGYAPAPGLRLLLYGPLLFHSHKSISPYRYISYWVGHTTDGNSQSCRHQASHRSIYIASFALVKFASCYPTMLKELLATVGSYVGGKPCPSLSLPLQRCPSCCCTIW